MALRDNQSDCRGGSKQLEEVKPINLDIFVPPPLVAWTYLLYNIIGYLSLFTSLMSKIYS